MSQNWPFLICRPWPWRNRWPPLCTVAPSPSSPRGTASSLRPRKSGRTCQRISGTQLGRPSRGNKGPITLTDRKILTIAKQCSLCSLAQMRLEIFQSSSWRPCQRHHGRGHKGPNLQSSSWHSEKWHKMFVIKFKMKIKLNNTKCLTSNDFVKAFFASSLKSHLSFVGLGGISAGVSSLFVSMQFPLLSYPKVMSWYSMNSWRWPRIGASALAWWHKNTVKYQDWVIVSRTIMLNKWIE